MAYIKEHQAGSEIYYPIPLHLQVCFKELGYNFGDLPNAERAVAETLAFPIYPELKEEQLHHVVRTMQAFYQG